jgi:ketosteroid isomerase-like protein
MDSRVAIDVHSRAIRRLDELATRPTRIDSNEVTMHPQHNSCGLRATMFALLAMSLLAPAAKLAAQTSGDEQSVWKLERDYRRYVQANDLKSDRDLWHDKFLGWPSMSGVPVHKDHITDWITLQTGKALAFQFGEFKPAEVQVTGGTAVACYWVTYKWVDQTGNGDTNTVRITHVWKKVNAGWRIIGGMSMQVPALPQ